MSDFYTFCQQYGNKLLYRGFKDDIATTARLDFAPTLYVNGSPNSKFKTLYGHPVDPVNFPDIREAREFLKTYKDVHGFDISGQTNFAYAYIAETFSGEVQYDISKMHISTLDIECETESGKFPNIGTANEVVNLISMHNKTTGHVDTFGCKDYTPKSANVKYWLCKDEKSMLRTFMNFWASNYPDIVTGWNVEGFDFPYLINRIVRVLGEDEVKQLSPFNIIHEKTVQIRNKDVQTYDIVGVVQLDYLDLYKKFGQKKLEQYTLDVVCEEELGEGKLDLPGTSWKDNYTNHWETFVSYNVRDVILVSRLDNKLQIIDLILSMTYMTKANVRDLLGTVRYWDIFIYNYLLKKNIVIPPEKHNSRVDFAGAYVKDPKPGMYGWVLSFDFASMYPHLVMQSNLSPETYVNGERLELKAMDFVNPTEETLAKLKWAKEHDYSVGCNGTLYTRKVRGFLPEMMDMLFQERKKVKKEMLELEKEYQKTHDETLKGKIAALNNRQTALKLALNSAYGAVSSPYFRYFNVHIAEAITQSGFASIVHMEHSVNKYVQNLLGDSKDRIITCDTDAFYLDIDDLVKKVNPKKPVDFLDKISESKLMPVVQKSIDTIAELCNVYEKRMNMKREAIASRGIYVAGKNYALVVHNSEGVSYDPPKMKVMGLALVKSSTPMSIRKSLREALNLIFTKDVDAVREFAKNLEREFRLMPPGDIAFPRGVTDVEKYANSKTVYSKGCPIHVRGSLLYNKLLPDEQPINNGDKIRFIYLNTPNPIKEDVIAWPANGKIPTSLLPYVNFDLQFEKVFIQPLSIILNAIKWELEPTSSLDSFF